MFIFSLISLVFIASAYLFFRETVDRYNPLIEAEYVYVEIQGEPEEDNGRYKYSMQGVTEGNETKTVVFTTSTPLDHGTYVRVLAKGTFAEEYEFIEEEHMPVH
ncbi:YxeA family protein [Geomicrobium sp. JCM 19037]|uniref:YxeA family protein n=1 Tax=Geomicrobium sp. JCM 19037 TaxID=1460634 RepID=UPI0005A6B83D|nr:YxeA family protein [Geomicrobium sp. JCM 19037]